MTGTKGNLMHGRCLHCESAFGPCPFFPPSPPSSRILKVLQSPWPCMHRTIHHDLVLHVA
eukprot:10382969-Prorocentrum_lima.AAC.1